MCISRQFWLYHSEVWVTVNLIHICCISNTPTLHRMAYLFIVTVLLHYYYIWSVVANQQRWLICRLISHGGFCYANKTMSNCRHSKELSHVYASFLTPNTHTLKRLVRGIFCCFDWCGLCFMGADMMANAHTHTHTRCIDTRLCVRQLSDIYAARGW